MTMNKAINWKSAPISPIETRFSYDVICADCGAVSPKSVTIENRHVETGNAFFEYDCDSPEHFEQGEEA